MLPAAIEAVRARGGLVVAQLNPRVPYTYGDAELPVRGHRLRDRGGGAAAVAAAARGDGGRRRHRRPGGRAHRRRRDAAGRASARSPTRCLPGCTARRGLTVWSEMFSDGVLGLAKAGALDAAQPVTASFAFGSADLYAWMDRNPDVRMLRTETVNDPALIARRPRMASVNGALQVDLFAQANATWVKGRDPLGVRRPDRLRRRCAALARRPGDHRAAVLASQGGRVHRRATARRPCDVVPAQLHRQRAGRRGDLGTRRRGQAEQIIEHVAHPSARERLREAAHELGRDG